MQRIPLHLATTMPELHEDKGKVYDVSGSFYVIFYMIKLSEKYRYTQKDLLVNFI